MHGFRSSSKTSCLLPVTIESVSGGRELSNDIPLAVRISTGRLVFIPCVTRQKHGVHGRFVQLEENTVITIILAPVINLTSEDIRFALFVYDCFSN